MLHEEIGAVIFGRDGIGIGFGDALQDLDVGDVEFVAAGGALIGADFAFDDDAGFLVRPLMASKTSGGTAFFGTTPWMMPVPSRNCGKRSLPLSRRL